MQSKDEDIVFVMNDFLTTSKVSKNGVFLVRIFPHSVFRPEYGDLIKSPYSVRIGGNTDQKKLRILTLFTQCFSIKVSNLNIPQDQDLTVDIN